MAHADLEAEYQQLRVDAAIEALKSEWASPQVLGSYNLKTAGGGGRTGSNPRSSTGTYQGLSQSPREGGSSRIRYPQQAELQFFGASDHVPVPAMGLSPVPYDYRPEVFYADDGEGMRGTGSVEVAPFIDQHRDLTSRADIFGNRSKHISPPRPPRNSRYNSTFTPFDDVTNQPATAYDSRGKTSRKDQTKLGRPQTPRKVETTARRAVKSPTTSHQLGTRVLVGERLPVDRDDRPVEDRLLQAQQEYAARKIAAREEKERRESRHLSGSPSISARSKKLMAGRSNKSDSPAAAFDRLSEPKHMPTQDPDAQAKEARKKAQPQINEVSKAIGSRGYDAQKSWAQCKEERLAAIRRRDDKEARQHNTGRPMINPVSRQIAVNKDALDGMEGLNIEDRLLVRDHQHSHRLEEARREKELDARVRSNIANTLSAEGLSPTSKTSKSRSRSKTNATNRSSYSTTSEEAGKRLFKDALTRDARREEEAKRRELLECFDPRTGQELYRPAIKTTEVLLLPSGEALGETDCFAEPKVNFDYVPATSLDELAQPRPGRRLDEEPNYDENFTGKPKIGDYSRLLAQMKKAREEEEADTNTAADARTVKLTTVTGGATSDFDRLAKPRIHKDPRIEYSFKPELNPNSEQIERLWQHHQVEEAETGDHRGSVMNRIDSLLERKKQYDAHRERLRLQQERDEDLAIEKAQKQLMKEIGRDHSTVRARTPPATARAQRFEQDSFVHRQNAWNAKRDAKLDKQRRGRVEEELIANDCTFTPRVNTQSSSTTAGTKGGGGSSPDALVEEVSIVLARHCKKPLRRYSDALPHSTGAISAEQGH